MPRAHPPTRPALLCALFLLSPPLACGPAEETDANTDDRPGYSDAVPDLPWTDPGDDEDSEIGEEDDDSEQVDDEDSDVIDEEGPYAGYEALAAPIDLSDLGEGVDEPFALTGVTLDARTGGSIATLWPNLVVFLDANGAVSETVTLESESGDQIWPGDVALMANERHLVLPSPEGVMLYDRDLGLLEDYFCLLPPIEDEDVLLNDAVAIDDTTGTIHTAPAYSWGWGGEPYEAYHARYRFDGSLQSQTDVLATGIVAKGFAFHAESGRLLAVQGDRAYAFDTQGQLLAELVLEDIDSASGIAIDEDHGRILVTEEYGLTIRSAPLQPLLP